jgi:arylsulfatase
MLAATFPVTNANADEVLPRPEEPFAGKIGLTYKDSTPVKPQLKVPATFGIEDAPNILIVLLDDVGFGQMGTFAVRFPRRRSTAFRYT